MAPLLLILNALNFIAILIAFAVYGEIAIKCQIENVPIPPMHDKLHTALFISQLLLALALFITINIQNP